MGTNVFNGRKFNGWSSTGPLNKPQPDGILKADGFGEQACTALLDNFFNDGLTWHDTKCNDRRHIVCEDLPVGNIPLAVVKLVALLTFSLPSHPLLRALNIYRGHSQTNCIVFIETSVFTEHYITSAG